MRLHKQQNLRSILPTDPVQCRAVIEDGNNQSQLLHPHGASEGYLHRPERITMGSNTKLYQEPNSERERQLNHYNETKVGVTSLVTEGITKIREFFILHQKVKPKHQMQLVRSKSRSQIFKAELKMMDDTSNASLKIFTKGSQIRREKLSPRQLE